MVVSAVPNSRLADRSTSSHVSSSRSAIVSRTCSVCGSSGHVPVDAADVVARLVDAGLAGFGAVAGHEPAVVAVQQTVEPAGDGQLEAPQHLCRPADVERFRRHAGGTLGVDAGAPVATAGTGAGVGAGAIDGAMRGAGTVPRMRASRWSLGEVAGERFVREHEAVAQHVGGDVEHVLGQGVGAAAQQGQGPCPGDEPEARPRAGAVLDEIGEVGEAEVGRRPCGQDEVHRVVDDAAVDVHVIGGALQRDELLGVEHRIGRRRVDAHAQDDLDLLVAGRVADQHLHEEAVALGLGQRIDALALDRVLRGEHEEGFGHRVGDAADRSRGARPSPRAAPTGPWPGPG